MTATVRLTGISKRFGAVQALDRVDFEAHSGGVHALVGENGAGKTTLMRVLYGALQPDAGGIELRGGAVRFRRSADAIRARIGMVSQHYSIIPELTCLQNLMLGAEPGWAFGQGRARERAQELAERMGFSFEWGREASSLSPAGAQKLEILKLLWRDAEVLILDEPTAMLSPADSDALYDSLGQLAQGGATVIVVTHRLPEVMAHAQTVTVLRQGRFVASAPVAQTSASDLAEMIVGHAVTAPAAPVAPTGEPFLVVDGLRAKGERGEEALKGASFEVREGELLGLAGVDGNGQRELFRALAGVLRAEGRTELGGENLLAKNPAERIACGVRLIPEDRHAEGAVDDWSLEENAALGLQRLAPLARGAWVDHSARLELAERVAQRFGTRHAGLRQPMHDLSGGNQQRFVAARALELSPRLILAFQPTRGLDIDGSEQVYGAIREACARGAAAVVVSFDLDELLERCDRVMAIRGGVVYAPKPEEARDRVAIGRLMVGLA